jgi:hypothetical protein
MNRALSLVVAFLVGATVSAGPASAQDQWTAPQRLADAQAEIVNVVSSGSGDIFSTYFANGTFDVTRRPSGKWVRGNGAAGGNHRDSGTGSVVDDDGNVTVAYPVDAYCPANGSDDEWGADPSDFRIVGAFRPFGKEPRVFSLPGQWDGCSESVPALDVDAHGTVTAVWSGDGFLHAAQRRRGQRWSTPVAIGKSPGTEFDVVVTDEDHVTAVWATSRAIRSATSRTFGHWAHGRKVAQIPDGYPLNRGEHVSVVSTGRGSLLAAWSDFTLHDHDWRSRVRFATADRLGRWRAAHTVERIAALPVKVQAVAIAAHGRSAVLAWHSTDPYADAGGPLRVRVRTAGAWSPTKLLDRRADQFGPNGLAATDAGTALVWTGGEAGNYFPLASTRRWADGWGTPHLLSSQGPPDEGLAARRVPWVVAYKPDVFTAGFPRDCETWSSDLRLGATR